MIAVKVLALLTQENNAGKMRSTLNQLKHGRDVLYAIMVLNCGVVSIDHTPHTIIAHTALPSVL